MTNISTQWRINVTANTAQARSQLGKFAKTAKMANMSLEQMFDHVKGAPSSQMARTFKGVDKEINKMNVALKRGNVELSQFGRYRKHANTLIKRSKQLQMANTIAIKQSGSSMASYTAVMKRFNQVQVTAIERLAFMNRFLRQASRSAINTAKNMQWSGRQITVGFGVPFGVAMAGASMAFFKFEEQLVRFRKVFNDEINDLSIEEAEERITGLANTMATQLGVARDEVMETSALFAQMGYQVEEIERLTKATTELAMLGETDAQEAGKLLRAYSASGFVDTFIQEGGSREEFEDYIKDMLNAVENNTGLSIASMVEAGMAQLVPLWSQMGVGAGVGESILAGMTEALGGRTSEAVTALKAIMQRVYDESTETTEQFGFLGVDIESLQDKYKDDFVGLVEELGNILATNPDIQNNNKAVAETFGNLFGVRQANRAIAGLRAVSNAFDAAGDPVNDYGRALSVIDDRQGNAQRSARELRAQAESVGGQFRRLKEAVMITASSIGETFLDFIMPAVRVLRDMVEWFANLSEGAQRMAMGIGIGITAIGGILSTVGVLKQAIFAGIHAIAAALPKHIEWTEEMLKNRMATESLNAEMNSQKSVIGEIKPLWESIEQAHLQVARATDVQTQSVRELSAAYRGMPAGATIGGVGRTDWSNEADVNRRQELRDRLDRGDYSTPTARARRERLDEIRSGGRVSISGRGLVHSGRDPRTGRFTTPRESPRWTGQDPDTGQFISRAEHDRRRRRAQNRRLDRERAISRNARRRDIEAAFRRSDIDRARDGRSAIGTSTLSGRQSRTLRRNQLSRQRYSNRSYKFRRGTAGAGAVAMALGSVLPGKVGSAAMGAGVGLEALSFLNAPKLLSKVTDFSDKLAKAARNSTGIRASLKGGASSILSMGATLPGIGVAVAAVAGSAFLIANHIKNAREEAEMLKNEFELAQGVGEELGLELEDISPGFGLGRLSESEDFEELSGEMQSIVRTLEDAEDEGAAYLGSVVRNLARQWQEGGATIEEINESLDELEATVGINIDPVSLDELSSTISQDLSRSIRLAMMDFTGNDRFWEFATDKEFNAQEEQMLRNTALTLQNSLERTPQDTLSHIQTFQSTLDDNPFLSEANKKDAIDRIQEIIGQVNGLTPELVAQAETIEEMLSIVVRANAEQARNSGEPLSREEILGLEEFGGLTEDSLVFTTDELEQLNTARETLDATGKIVAGISDMGRIDLLNIDSVEGAEEALTSVEQTAEQMLKETGHFGYVPAIGLADTLRLAIEDTEDTTKKLQLQALLRALEEALGLVDLLDRDLDELLTDSRAAAEPDYIMQFIGSGSYESVVDSMPEAFDFSEMEEAFEEAGGDSVDSYVSAFRSELGSQRDDFISDIIDQFDEVTDEIIEGIEEQRDAESEAIDDRIDKIDEYLDKQKEIQKAMQDQIDLNVALAKGERGKAAQIQNALRFGTLQDMAKSEKDRLKEEKDGIKDVYDQRVEREKELREEQKITLEENLEGLEDMFLGSVSAWQDFADEASSIAMANGLAIPEGISQGFTVAMDNVEREMQLDQMWDNVNFPNLERAIAVAAGEGVTEGLNAAFDQFRQHIQSLREGRNEQSGYDIQLWDQAINDLIGQASQFGFDPSSLSTPSSGSSGGSSGGSGAGSGSPVRSSSSGLQNRVMGIWRHSGGPMPGGPRRDVPAVLQTGEYVIQRDAVNALGTGFLDELNNYHTGGFIGIGAALGGAMISNLIGSVDPEPERGQRTLNLSSPIKGGKTSVLVPPDRDATWRYDNWRVGMNQGVIEKAASALANLSGGQTITSAYRSRSENTAINGAKNSDHIKGKAIDFVDQANQSLSRLDAMGRYFEGRPGVRWVGRPGTDPTGGHNDHVHVSYYHNGGLVGRGGGKRVQVPTHNTPNSSMAVSSSGVNINIGNFNGTEENIDLLVDKVRNALDRHERKVNPTRSFS